MQTKQALDSNPLACGKPRHNTLIKISSIRLVAVGYSKGYSKTLEYEYRVKTDALGTLKRYSILSHSIFRVVQCLLYNGQWRAPLATQRKKCYNS
jgi:hypothetical protein